jgi:hypothetical protein
MGRVLGPRARAAKPLGTNVAVRKTADAINILHGETDLEQRRVRANRTRGANPTCLQFEFPIQGHRIAQDFWSNLERGSIVFAFDLVAPKYAFSIAAALLGSEVYRFKVRIPLADHNGQAIIEVWNLIFAFQTGRQKSLELDDSGLFASVFDNRAG